jgi:maltoporin
MQDMRVDYEHRMQLLEQRLDQIEGHMPVTNGPGVIHVPGGTNAVPTAAERGEAFARIQYQENTEMRNVIAAESPPPPFRERLEKVLNHYVDITGYFRAGYGRDDKGGPQPAFQAPGAFAKYRLGNEAEDYGELTIGKNWYVPDLFSMSPEPRPDGTPTGPIAHFQMTQAFYNPYSDKNGGFNVSFPEIWASIGNVFASQPSVKFWAGNRFYRRQDININDFWFYNMSGAGGGVEDFELGNGNGKLALAWIGNGSQSGVYSSDIAALPDPNNLAGFSKQSIDLSLYDFEMPLGKGEFAVVYANGTSGLDANGQQAPNSQGAAFNFIHTHPHFLSADGVNRFSLQFGTGAAKTFTSGYETVTLTNGTFIVPDDPNSWRFRVTESFVSDLSDHFSISPALVYQYTDYHSPQGTMQWLSAGVRPIYHFTKNLSLAFEAGVDHVISSGTSPSGTLCKLTLAPQVALGNKFFSRPVLRAYVTYAGWTDGFKGSVGGTDYMNDRAGLVWGMQMEAWW